MAEVGDRIDHDPPPYRPGQLPPDDQPGQHRGLGGEWTDVDEGPWLPRLHGGEDSLCPRPLLSRQRPHWPRRSDPVGAGRPEEVAHDHPRPRFGRGDPFRLSAANAHRPEHRCRDRGWRTPRWWRRRGAPAGRIRWGNDGWGGNDGRRIRRWRGFGGGRSRGPRGGDTPPPDEGNPEPEAKPPATPDDAAAASTSEPVPPPDEGEPEPGADTPAAAK